MLGPIVDGEIVAVLDGVANDSASFGQPLETFGHPHEGLARISRKIISEQIRANRRDPVLAHTYAVDIGPEINAGASVKVVQNMLGHSSAAMTLDVYSDLFDTDVDDVAERIDAARSARLA